MVPGTTNGVNGSAPTQSNAAMLLNPRGASKPASKPAKEPPNSESFAPSQSNAAVRVNARPSSMTGTTSKSDGDETTEVIGMGSLIEKQHKVEDRPDRPMKRQKQSHKEEDDDDEVKVTKSTYGSGGGENGLGQYFKEKREDQQNGEEKDKTPVDLTIGDDDEVVVTLDKRKQEEVCLGWISTGRVNAHKVPTPKMSGIFNPHQNSIWPAMKCELHRRPGNSNNVIIGVSDAQGRDFGVIDPRVAPALAPLMDAATTRVRLQARLDSRKRHPYEVPGGMTSDVYKIGIHVYAPRKNVPSIGRWLSQKQVLLSEPLVVDRGVPVVNPHRPTDHTPDPKNKGLVASTSKDSTATSYVTRTNEQVKEDVNTLMNSLGEIANLEEMEADARIKTPLLKHQKQALYFMTEREKNRVLDAGKQLWKSEINSAGRQIWYNVVTGHQQKDEPEPHLGGILADVMGLGKTLNVLALIIGSKEESKKYGESDLSEVYDNDDSDIEMNAKGTLLVCPLSTMVNWEEQIKTHCAKKAITYTVHHGPARTSDMEELRKYDMVITTYSVVSSDFNRRSRKRSNSPLFELAWFRIVLDEAHTIREQSTRTSKACCALEAQRRWCLTGTPVQNRMDDLGALIKFLRIKPFDKQGNFAQYITAPLKSADVDALPKLRVLVDSITLRRLKDRLTLPNRTERIAKLKMSDAERALYNAFDRDSRSKFSAVVGKKERLAGNAMAHILKAILRMRLLCAHGGELLSEADWELAKGFSASHAIDLEEEGEREDRTARQCFEMFRMIQGANMHSCARCYELVKPNSEIIDDDAAEEEDEGETEDTFGYLAPCNQLVCPKCFDEFRENLRAMAGPDNYVHCVSCGTYMRIHFFELKQSELNADEQAQSEVRKNPKLAKHAGRYSGPHTKTKALVEALKKNQEWSEQHPDEPPIKSVVFSGWTSHLDLIQIALTEANIKFSRLDGSMTRAHRNAALHALATDPKVCVILVSLTAGGLGLNLTAASRVYVMEPQFNPAAESQAVERVHRLGQQRDVEITKFIMQDSFEEKMVELQRNKESLANLSLDRNAVKLDKQDAAKKSLENLRHLFR